MESKGTFLTVMLILGTNYEGKSWIFHVYISSDQSKRHSLVKMGSLNKHKHGNSYRREKHRRHTGQLGHT